MQLNFNDGGRLQTIKKYDSRPMRENITMVSRITPTAGKELTVLEQIMGNVGRFSGPRSRAIRARRPAAAPDSRSSKPNQKAPVLRPGLFV